MREIWTECAHKWNKNFILVADVGQASEASTPEATWDETCTWGIELFPNDVRALYNHYQTVMHTHTSS